MHKHRPALAVLAAALLAALSVVVIAHGVLRGGELAGGVPAVYAHHAWLAALGSHPALWWTAVPVLLLALLGVHLVERHAAEAQRLRALIERDFGASEDVGKAEQTLDALLASAGERMRRVREESAERQAMLRVLAYQKACVEAVLEAVPEAVVVMDTTATVTYANRKLGSMVGIEHEGIIGRTPLDWCPEGPLREFLAGVAGTVVRSNKGAQLEIEPQHVTGRRVAVTAYPLFAPRSGGDQNGTLVVFQDVTREAMAAQARRDFVAHLSHELKTPLHVVGMYAEMLQEGMEGEQQIEAGNVIHDEVERVTALINNLLSIARIETGSTSLARKRVRALDLLKDCFDVASRGCGDLRMHLDVDQELPPINVDKELLRVAINNLLTNAIKYNRPGGEVVLGAEDAGDSLRIFVRDTGLGIAPADQQRVFEKFVRVDSAAPEAPAGHGLGLALAREIVELHHGKLTLSSEPGRGSEFSIVLQKTPLLLREAA